MKRLFLTSFGLSAFPAFVGKDPKKVTIGFIPTAANLASDKWYVEKDRNFLIGQGYTVVEIDIEHKSQVNKLNNVDLIYFSGGNTFYLLEKAIESGALQLIKQLVNNGKLYAGASAGAVFAGPSVAPVALLDDPNDAPNLKNYDSLGLVDFVVLPHYGKKKYVEKYKQIMKDFGDSKFKLIMLTDQQAIVVEGDGHKIVESI